MDLVEEYNLAKTGKEKRRVIISILGESASSFAGRHGFTISKVCQQLRAGRCKIVSKVGITRDKKSGLYLSWSAMRARCYSKNNIGYNNYGGEGY